MDAFMAGQAFADNRRRYDVARLQRMQEGFAVLVDQHRAEGADLFRHQGAVNLRRIGGSRRMILYRVGVYQRHAGPISQHQPVCRRAVVIGRRKALIVQPPCASRGNDDAFCPDDMIFLRIEII